MAGKRKGGHRRGMNVTPKSVIVLAAGALPLIDYAKNALNAYAVDKDAIHAMTGVTSQGKLDKAFAIAQGTRLIGAYVAPKVANFVLTKATPPAAKRVLNAKLARV